MVSPRASHGRSPTTAPGTRWRGSSTSTPRSTSTSSNTIWRRSWLFAGTRSQARIPGDFFRFDARRRLDDRRARARIDGLHALHNTCRHRGCRSARTPRATRAAGSARTTSGAMRSTGPCSEAGGMERRLDADRVRPAAAPVFEVGGLGVRLAGPMSSLSRSTKRECELAARARAPGTRTRQGRSPDRVPRRRQLEARLGEQPRVLALPRRASAVRQGQL